jgi:hypothetical protein
MLNYLSNSPLVVTGTLIWAFGDFAVQYARAYPVNEPDAGKLCASSFCYSGVDYLIVGRQQDLPSTVGARLLEEGVVGLISLATAMYHYFLA